MPKFTGASAMADAPVNFGIQYFNVTCDPVTGNFLFMSKTGGLYEYDPRGSGTWTLQTGTRVPPSALAEGSDTYRSPPDAVISFPVSNYGVVAYVTCASTN